MLQVFVERTETCKKEETPTTELCRQQTSVAVEVTRNHFKNCYALPLWWVGFNNNHQFASWQLTFSSSSQHFLEILLFLLPFTRNLLCIRRPNSCIVVWQQLICWLVLLTTFSVLYIGCPCFKNTGAFVDT